MRPTLNHKIVDNDTVKVESFDEDEVTAVGAAPENRHDFVLTDRDVDMIRRISIENGLSYEATVHAVLRDALDLYHWNNDRLMSRKEVVKP